MTALPRVLCVDDEPAVLEGLMLHLRRRFEVATALSGAAGIEAVRGKGPFACVLSDMRMPGMSGAEFLKQVRHLAPNTVRVLLTGQADMTSAVSAVNEGQIFRFLTKPCPPPSLLAALEAAVGQHALMTAERELLERTLRGTVKMLGDVLALANPLAFGRMTRAKALIEAMLSSVAPSEVWKAEVACLFSQLGAINLPPGTLERWYRGEPLSADEKALVDKLPHAADTFVSTIPRLEAVREILSSVARGDKESAPVGAKALRVAFDFEAQRSRGDTEELALETLKGRRGNYDDALLDALEAHLKTHHGPAVRELSAKDIRPGMVLAEDMRTRTGMLLVPRGFEVTAALQARFSAMADGTVKEPIRVLLR